MEIIQQTGILSLLIQFITGIFGLYVLTLSVSKEFFIIKELLFVEFFVQIIEFVFYSWMIINFNTIKNITPTRYFDWFFTTPTMLVTLALFLVYLKEKEENNIIQDSYIQLFTKHAEMLTLVIILNWLMLLAGYLGEQRVFSFYNAAILGFIPFGLMFYLIYSNYAHYTSEGNTLFWWFVGIWSLYGLASIMSYKIKNVMYNILDLFSKNFFGFFLAYVLYRNI